LKKPEPTPGLVIRYDYLWRAEQKRGRVDGAKDRPCAIILAYEADDNGNRSVILAAITHSQPTAAADAVEIPAKVKKNLGLDDERSWIVTTEINRVSWDDAGITPVKRGQWVYGMLPFKLWKLVQDSILERSQRRRLGIVQRKP
jgi:mRNA-degrading endonuclease toxin of MazEF toxin-antitoxin module